MKINTLSALVLFLFFAHSQSVSAASPAILDEAFKVNTKKISVYTTAASTTQRLSLTGFLNFSTLEQPKETQICVFVDPGKKFQTFMGIGGALTDASAETFAKLPELKQREFLRAYFDTRHGIGYTLARTNIHSCDFSSGSYTYVKNGDKTLKSFSIDHDLKFRVPFIKKAIEAAGGNLPLFASPWSPPAYMKDNNNMLQGGKLKPEYYQIWADYYVKFIRAYENEGIPVWGLTVQNEPMATQRWESCIYTASEERDFLKNYLGPTLEKAGLSDKKIIVWDHNRDLMYQRANVIFDDPEASKYAWGMGFHWYEDWSGGQQMYCNVGLVNKVYPDKNLIFTEGCAESFNAERYYSWGLGEEYGRSMIHDFNNGTVAWTDWNILLDETGGPNHVNNFCFAPVHADTKTGQLIYTNSYYYIGHFSKFIRPGARRILAAASRSQLLSTAFMNEDGKIAVVVMNQSDQEVIYNLCVGSNAAEVKSPARSIQTITF
ncbi:MAG: glycoside hydrolase family 30 protein [Candidatus Riflebacteria bacterium]|nr:glycoside hydrolase family 30 protein [Candidatus Riflebacteria bacterium]